MSQTSDDIESIEETLAILSDPVAIKQIRESERAFAAGESTTSLTELRRSLQEWLSADQRQRFEGLIKNLNTPPLGVRLTRRLDEDGVPLGEHERELLFGTLVTPGPMEGFRTHRRAWRSTAVSASWHACWSTESHAEGVTECSLQS